MDVLVLISNCPQLNNPCNAYNPTPIGCWSGTSRPHERRRRAPCSDKVLIANRGAIACRIIRTLRALGRRVGRGLLRGGRAFAARRARPTRRCCSARPPAAESYLRRGAHPRRGARRRGAEAIHPGYGFLSENAGLRRSAASAPASRSSARRRSRCARSASSTRRASIADEHGVPLLPGTGLLDDAARTRCARRSASAIR